MQAKLIFLPTHRKQAPVRVVFIILTFCFTLINAVSFSQEKKLKIYPTIGLSWRSTVTNFLNFNGVYKLWNTHQLYAYERNMQGFSLNTGFLLAYKNWVEFEYYPNWRYDVIQWKRNSVNEFEKEFIIDHNFNLQIKHKITYGIGMSIINTGKGYYDYNSHSGEPIYQNIQFNSFNAFVQVPVKKIVCLEIKMLYIPSGFPTNPDSQLVAFGLRAYYRFNFLNSPKPKQSATAR